MTQFFDLENGYMILAGRLENNSNCWQTGVECILTRINSHGEVQCAWLSHECRTESVSPDIFSDRNFEFVVVKGWNESIVLRSGSYNYGFNPISNFLGKEPKTTHEVANIGAEVFCTSRKVKVLGFDEAPEFFQKESDGK